MPRIADHPRAGLARALELAAAVEDLGGECSLGAAAARLGAKPGGTFGALVSSAAKYGWISIRRGRLRTEGRYRDYRLARDESQRQALLLEALRAAPLFRRLLDRFAGRAVPLDHLPKLLAREFEVPESGAVRIAGYFVAGARAAGVLEGGRVLASHASVKPPLAEERRVQAAPAHAPHGTAPYTLRVSGPDLETSLELADLADLDLLRAVVAKIERGLRVRRRGQ